MLTHLVKHLFEQKRMTAARIWIQRLGESQSAFGISVKDDNLHLIVDGKKEVWTSGRLYKQLQQEGTLSVIWELVSYYPIDVDYLLREVLHEHDICLENVPFYLTKDGRLKAESEWSGKAKPTKDKLPKEIGDVVVDTSGVSVLIRASFAREALLRLLAQHIEGAVAFEDGGGRIAV
jgi:hypothetical protein